MMCAATARCPSALTSSPAPSQAWKGTSFAVKSSSTCFCAAWIVALTPRCCTQRDVVSVMSCISTCHDVIGVGWCGRSIRLARNDLSGTLPLWLSTVEKLRFVHPHDPFGPVIGASPTADSFVTTALVLSVLPPIVAKQSHRRARDVLTRPPPVVCRCCCRCCLSRAQRL